MPSATSYADAYGSNTVSSTSTDSRMLMSTAPRERMRRRLSGVDFGFGSFGLDSCAAEGGCVSPRAVVETTAQATAFAPQSSVSWWGYALGAAALGFAVYKFGSRRRR